MTMFLLGLASGLFFCVWYIIRKTRENKREWMGGVPFSTHLETYGKGFLIVAGYVISFMILAMWLPLKLETTGTKTYNITSIHRLEISSNGYYVITHEKTSDTLGPEFRTEQMIYVSESDCDFVGTNEYPTITYQEKNPLPRWYNVDFKGKHYRYVISTDMVSDTIGSVPKSIPLLKKPKP